MAADDWDIESPFPTRDESHQERSLWCEVILTAMRDAKQGDAFALRWFSEPSGQFAYLCQYLNLHPVQICGRIERMIDKHKRAGRLLTAKTDKG